MILYTKTQLRPLVNENLRMDTLTGWIKRIEAWTLYEFNFGVPTNTKVYRHGQPVRRKVYDEADVKRLRQLYDLRVNENYALAYAVFKIFSTKEHFEKWEKGEFSKALELKKNARRSRKKMKKGLPTRAGSLLRKWIVRSRRATVRKDGTSEVGAVRKHCPFRLYPSW